MELVTGGTGVDFREVLENGNLLFFPDGGFEISREICQALTGEAQDARSVHKNIAYKPNADKVSGLKDARGADRVRHAMREYSRAALAFAARILPDYARAWKVDYASFRSIEERGRVLPLKKRNDLLHIDAFPTRPVFGDLILRCFTNVNPEQSREWLVSDGFALLAPREAEKAGLKQYAAMAGSPLHAVRRGLMRAFRAGGAPVVDRSPYDAFMLHFHDWLKGNREYQETAPKYRFDFPPGSTWLAFTDVVPHAVLGGRLAMEQTTIVSRGSLRNPASAPSAILEKMAGRSLIS